MPDLKMKRITTADLFLNDMPGEIFSIEFDSTEMSEEETLREASRLFQEKMFFKYHEEWVKK